MAVGNVESDNARYSPQASFGSNWGLAVDIFGPGTDIVSASQLSDTSTRTATGTSDASPFVAGLVCYLRTLEGVSTPAEATARVFELATDNLVIDPKGSANRLAYNGSGLWDEKVSNIQYLSALMSMSVYGLGIK